MRVYMFKALRLLIICVLYLMWITHASFIIMSSEYEKWIEESKQSDLHLFDVILLRCCSYFFLYLVDGVPSNNVPTLVVDFSLIITGYCFSIYSLR